jgi:transmembrane sensor
MISVPEHIEIILEKQLKGSQDPAEMQVLDQWRKEKAEHELFYRQLTRLWQESGAVLQEPVYDANKAWEKLDATLRPKRTIRPIYRLLMAACVLGVLCVAGWMLLGRNALKSVQLADKSNRQLTLPDGSTVVLRKGASITYPESFKERAVILNGEAFFDVQPDKNRPFRIQTARAVIEVLGTSFIINSNKQYDQLVVTSGKVAFIDKERHVVSARETATLDEKGFNITPVKDSNYLSWQTGILKFENTPIDQVAATLSDYYNLPIKLDNGLTTSQYTITAKFEQQPVEQVLEEIKLLVNLSYRKQHDTIILAKPY